MEISTHTPHAGRDVGTDFGGEVFKNFYSHAPCGARQISTNPSLVKSHFYSHAPCGARRLFCRISSSTTRFLLTRPMRGATPPPRYFDKCMDISTHTPHAGRDLVISLSVSAKTISTHTPHAGRDRQLLVYGYTPKNFYSHAPCGARPSGITFTIVMDQFLLTRPMRGATGKRGVSWDSSVISTHTPHAGRDGKRGLGWHTSARFLLTRPMRGATSR